VRACPPRNGRPPSTSAATCSAPTSTRAAARARASCSNTCRAGPRASSTSAPATAASWPSCRPIAPRCSAWASTSPRSCSSPAKRSLYAEVFALLEPGGTFANFEHVASPSHRLHLAFYAAIDEPLEHEDPSDRLLDVASQLAWLREIGFAAVDCYWKWLEMALLIGVKPA
jgi:hypothetical protein